MYLRNFLHRFIFEGGECALPHVAADLVSSCMFQVSELQSEEMNPLVIGKLSYTVRITPSVSSLYYFFCFQFVLFFLSHTTPHSQSNSEIDKLWFINLLRKHSKKSYPVLLTSVTFLKMLLLQNILHT